MKRDTLSEIQWIWFLPYVPGQRRPSSTGFVPPNGPTGCADMPLMKYRTRLLLLILLIAAPQPIVARQSLVPPAPAAALQAPELPSLQVSSTTVPAAQLDLSITDAVPPEKTLPLALHARFEPALYKQLLLASDDQMVRGILWMR
jgi:hypothetical protein